MKPIRWPFWAGLGTVAAAWLILGFTLPQTINLNDVFNGVSLAAWGAAFLFIVVYTVAGMLGPAKWWRNNIGTFLVLAAVSVLTVVGPTAYAVLFNHGVIDTWWLAWSWVAGHFLTAAMWLSLALLWVRNRPANNNGNSN